MPRSGSTRTFRCPSSHKHGLTGTCYSHGCGCDDCREGHTERSRARRKRIAYGRHQNWRVDKTVARDRVVALRDLGWTITGIADAGGVAVSAVQELVATRYKRTHRDTADAILTIPLEPPAKAMWNRVPSLGARRRVEALMFMGWSAALIEQHTGMGDRYLMNAVTKPLIEDTTHQRIVEVFDRLWNQSPPLTDKFSRGSYTRTRKLARERGWVGPLHWSDIDTDPNPPTVEPDDSPYIDDVKVARALAGEHHKLTHAEKREAVTIGHGRRWSDVLISHRTGMVPETVFRIRKELGLPAWVDPISRTEAA